ncbi:MAG: alpha/beta fold hydrolase [Acidimicrobiales bacterium]
MSDTRTNGSTTTRLDVHSPDGTPLAVWVDGEGPAIVLVHGCPSEHSTLDPLVAELRAHVTTYAMDRRGSGASGDTAPYAIEREFEDVAAVVDAVAARNAGPVALWGHSYGCNPAMGAAALTANVDHLVLYEPSFGMTYPPGAIDAIEQAVADGDPERAIRAALVDTGVMTDDDFATFKTGPRWPNVVASAPTLPRECRVEDDWTYQPGQFDAITAPTLLLTGSDTDPELAQCTQTAAAAIPNTRVRVLEGHGHFAYKSDPGMVAAIIRDFIST